MEVLLKVFLLGCATFFHYGVEGYEVREAPLLKSRPKWLKACRRNGPDINDCINDWFGSLFPYLAVGIPEIKVDPFEPLPLDRVSISKGSGAITLAGSLFNMNVEGPSNSTTTYSDFSEKEKYWNFGLNLPLLDIKSEYNLKGNILVLPLVGHGTCEIKLFDTKTKITTELAFPRRENREMVNIENMTVKFKVGKMRVKFHNLFNGNKILGKTVNSFINQNAVEIIDELEDSIGGSLAIIFRDLMNNIFTKIPTDLWLLSDAEYEKYVEERKNIENTNKTESV
ncbi:unnamed protein product [Brassicogethes aeneus]|uniref:Uncharacterized protein n=1 Tax=Brassicogethes aeneus TaxID=1431903 RepID=A0A9P0FIV4_BRAAE|nr:unnamed protein product [Brassicogethes aeneus]